MTTSPSSSSTSASLLDRVRKFEPQAWDRFVELYGAVVYRWCRVSGLRDSDAADVSQEVFRAVARGIRGFRRDQPGGSFRGWLWQITRNKVRDHYRRCTGQATALGGSAAHQFLLEIPVGATPAATDADAEFDTQSSIAHRALELVRLEFEERTWQAFLRVVVGGESASCVADELKMSAGAVYTAKWRVLRRLREEIEGLL